MENDAVHLSDKPQQAEAGKSGDNTLKPIPLEYGLASPAFVMPLWITVGMLVAVTSVGAYFITYLRTSDWGFDAYRAAILLVVSFMFFGPFVVFASLGRRYRTILICLLIVTLAPVLIAEGWAGVQEQDFVRRSRLTPGVPMSEARWWFTSNAIGTDGKGSFYGYD